MSLGNSEMNLCGAGLRERAQNILDLAQGEVTHAIGDIPRMPVFEVSRDA